MVSKHVRWWMANAVVLALAGSVAPRAWAAGATGDACRVIKADVDDDGADEIVMENAYLKVTIEPGSGGRLSRVEYKPAGVDLTCYGPYRNMRPGGLFGDRITTQSYPGEYLETTAEAKIVENTPGRVRVRLTTRGRSGPAAHLSIEKELVLKRECSSLGVKAAMSYRTGKTDPSEWVRTGLWWQHVLRVGKPGTQTGMPCRYFVPLTKGVLRAPFRPQARNTFPVKDGYMRHPARGWIGTVATPGGGVPPVGAVFTVEYAKLLHYYMCMVPGMLEFPTLEWYYQPVKLRDGDSFGTTVRLVPCRGLDTITGAGGGVVGEVRVMSAKPQVGQPVPVRVTLVSDRTRRVVVELSDRLLTWHTGKSTTTALASRPLALTVDRSAGVEVPVTVKGPGTHVMVVRVREAGAKGKPGETITTFETPMVVGGPSGNYALAPTVPRVVEDVAVKKRDNLAGPPTPHLAWAKPLRGGPVRALIVSDLSTARQVVELAQRLDMKCDDVLMYGSSLVEKDTPLLFGHRNAPSRHHYKIDEHESEAERLRRLITKNRYDVMVLGAGALRLGNVPKDVRQRVIERVRAGMGLVCLGAWPHKPGTGWLDPVMPLVVGPGRGISHHIHMTDDQRMRRGGIVRTSSPNLFRATDFARLVPMGLFPPMAMYTDDRLAKAPVKGKAVVQYNRMPMLVTGTAGAGRVAVLNAAMHNLELNTYFEDPLPAMRGERYQEFPYQEYAYLLVSKMVLWSAKREPDLRLEWVRMHDVGPDGIGLTVRVQSLCATPSTVNVEVAVRDRFDRVVAMTAAPRGDVAGKVTRKLGARGRSDVAVRMPGPCAAGRYTADVFLYDAAGRVADAGSVVVHVPGDTTIERATPHRALQRRGRPATVDVDVRSVYPRSAQITWRLVDTYRRTIQQETVPVDLSPGRNIVTLVTHPIRTAGAVLDLAVLLSDGDRPLHRHVSFLFVQRPRRVDDLMFEVYVLGGGAAADRSFPFMRRLGVDAGGVNYSGYPWGAAFPTVKNNMVPLFGSQFISDYGFYGSVSKTRSGPPRTWPDVKPDDPYNCRVWPGLARPDLKGRTGTCPHSPSYLEGRLWRVRTRGPVAMLYSPLDYFIADECTYQRNTYAKTKQSFDDLCFCRHCLVAFRQYLKKGYGTLDALNAGWGTTCKSWDDAMPLPGRQARLLPNWSRWIDYRIFTAKAYCGSVAQVQTWLRDIDPGSRTSANIHWESPWTAYMAYYLHGPGANATAEVYPRTFEQGRSYSPEPAFRRIHLGYASYPGHPRGVTDHYAWRNLCYGGGRVDFYNGIEGMYGGVLSPTYQTVVMGEWLQALDTAMRKTGVAKAVLSSTPDPPVVGVMESYPSQFSYYLEPQHFDKDGFYRRGDHAMWHDVKRVWGSYGALAEDLGLSWRLVNEEECTKAVPPGLRVLFLPRATCLAAHTAQALDRFVQGGGVVIGDVRLAERDRHGRPTGAAGPGWLASLFGVRRTRTGADTGQVKLKVTPSGAVTQAATVATNCHEPGIQPAGATPHGTFADGAAHTLVRRRGKGLFVYLNYELWGYGSDRSPAVRALVGSILTGAGIAPTSALVGPDGKPAINVLCLRRTRGPVRYHFILHNRHGPRCGKTALVLSTPAHLYDVGQHRYLGRHQRVTVKPSATRGQLIAAVPYRLTGLKVQVTPTAVQGATIDLRVALETSADKPGDHVVRVQVTRPDGSPCPYWSGNVLAERAQYKAAWSLAREDPAGTWRVHVLDVLSGATADATFAVTELPE